MDKNDNYKMILKLMLRLLPIQVLFVFVGMINGIVSTYFATNYVGIDAMSAVGLYGPINMFIQAVGTIFVGGSAIVCGKYIGQNNRKEVTSTFSVDMVITFCIAIFFTIVLLVLGFYDLTGIFTNDPNVRPLFNVYLIGQAIGILPFLLGNQFSVFLSLENKQRLSVIASTVFIAVNIAFNYLFVQVMQLQAFGLALAGSLGMLIFCLIEGSYFVSGKSYIRFSLSILKASQAKEIFTKGLPGALTYIYMTVRGFAVNGLLTTYVGSVGISAFAAANNLMSLFWAIPSGMQAVSRLLLSIGIGEEDKKTLTNVMRVMFKVYISMHMVVVAAIILLSKPLTNIFFHDPLEPVYMMTVWGLRILPLCMPFAIITMHFTSYAQASGKNVLVNILSLFDGVLGVVICSALLIGKVGMNAVYIANVLNGIIDIIIILLYAIIQNKHVPHNMEELMVIPKDFGVNEDDVISFTVKTLDEVTSVAEKIQNFCKERGVDSKRALVAGLAMEEMSGNVITHGFTKDKKRHSIDIKAIHKNDDVILRIKDDCIAFDPNTRNSIDDQDDPTKNFGIRMIYKIASEVNYQNILGLNVLTLKI